MEYSLEKKVLGFGKIMGVVFQIEECNVCSDLVCIYVSGYGLEDGLNCGWNITYDGDEYDIISKIITKKCSENYSICFTTKNLYIALNKLLFFLNNIF